MKSILLELGETTRDLLDAFHSEGRTTTVDGLRMKARVRRFSYEQGVRSLEVEHELESKPIWNRELQDSQFERIRATSVYSESLEELVSLESSSESQCSYYLDRYLQSLVHMHAAGELTDKNLSEQASLFARDLERLPVRWSLTSWLHGIWLADDEVIELDERSRIRRPTPADIERAESRDISTLSSLSNRGPAMTMPAAILEMTIECVDQHEAQQILLQAEAILRLFRLGGVVRSMTWYRPKSILRQPLLSGPTEPGQIAYTYPISCEDEDEIRHFFRAMGRVLPSKIWEIRRSNDPLDIAFSRYVDALVQPSSAESRITSSMTCLEALYLRGGERGELSRRLAERAAALLTHESFDPLETRETISKAYNIRSAYVHGAASKESGDRKADLCEAVLNYSRLSLQILYQLREGTSKEDLIALLDESLLESSARRRLNDLLSRDVITN